MRKSKRCIMSLLALILCLAIAAVFVFTFAGCDDDSASGEIVNDGDEYTLKDNEREKIKISDEPDENGIEQWEYFYKSCSICEDKFDCKGHDMYRTSVGTVYSFYPYTVPMTLTDENGDEDINSEIRASLVFDGEPVTYDDGECLYFYARPMIEIISLTGEPLDSSNFVLLKTIDYTYNGGWVSEWPCIHEEDDEIDPELVGGTPVYKEGDYTGLLESETSSDTAKSYEPFMYDSDVYDGYYVFYYTADDGELYTFDFYTIETSGVWGALVEGTVEIH